jgi:hypothetical protein
MKTGYLLLLCLIITMATCAPYWGGEYYYGYPYAYSYPYYYYPYYSYPHGYYYHPYRLHGRPSHFGGGFRGRGGAHGYHH